MDKLGIRLGVVIFTLILTIGQLVVAIGAINNNFVTMLIGRCIFGVGGENMLVGQYAIISNWFMG